MKDGPRQHFRLAPHVSGAANVKRKDYEESGCIEAANEYAAWDQLRPSRQPLEVGDLLETDSGELRICKYIGFEAAAWVVPPDPNAAPESLARESVAQESVAQESVAQESVAQETEAAGESHA